MVDLAGIGAILGGVGQAAGGAAGLFGGGGGSNYWQQLGIMREQAQLQREFAQNGIQWRVRDAQAAGIHPLYALGGSGASYSPSAVHVGDSGSPDLGRDLRDMGQGIGRAVAATASKEDRSDAAYQSQMRIMGLERASLENRLLETQIAASQSSLMRGQLGPGVPSGRSVDSSGVGWAYKDAEPTAPSRSHPGAEAGPKQAANRFAAVTPDGKTVVALPGKDFNFEDLSPGTVSWQFWNSILPLLSSDARDASRPTPDMLPKGKDYWEWTPLGYRARNYGPWHTRFPARPPASEYRNYYRAKSGKEPI